MRLEWLLAAVFISACFPPGSGSGSGGYGYSGPTLELTVNGVHFGPSAPAPGDGANLVTQYDGSGAVTGATLSLNAFLTGTNTGCLLAFSRYGGGIAALQYTVSSQQGTVTGSGQVYAGGGERVLTPAGGASCTGSGCDNAALSLSALDAKHVAGYFMGTMLADSGAGEASVVCSFWLPMLSYQP